jgi:hypothetical protein
VKVTQPNQGKSEFSHRGWLGRPRKPGLKLNPPVEVLASDETFIGCELISDALNEGGK